SCCNDFTRMVMPIAYVVVRGLAAPVVFARFPDPGLVTRVLEPQQFQCGAAQGAGLLQCPVSPTPGIGCAANRQGSDTPCAAPAMRKVNMAHDYPQQAPAAPAAGPASGANALAIAARSPEFLCN